MRPLHFWYEVTCELIRITVPFSSHYLLTVGGSNDRNVKLHSLAEDQSVPHCLQNLQQLPEAIYFGAGAALGPMGDNPVACGGKMGTRACYRYSLLSNEWAQSANLTHAHGGPGYTRHSQLGLVITGNSLNDGTKEKFCETTLDGENIKVRVIMLMICYFDFLINTFF